MVGYMLDSQASHVQLHQHSSTAQPTLCYLAEIYTGQVLPGRARPQDSVHYCHMVSREHLTSDLVFRCNPGPFLMSLERRARWMIISGDPLSSLSHILDPPPVDCPVPPISIYISLYICVCIYIYIPDLEEQCQACFLSASQTPLQDC